MNNLISVNTTLGLFFFTISFFPEFIYSQTVFERREWGHSYLQTADSVSYLSKNEKEVVFYLNMARTDPKKFAEAFLYPMKIFFDGKRYREPEQEHYVLTHEGITALNECIEEMKNTKPLGILYPSEGLSKAAFDHALYQSITGETGHSGKDNKRVVDRIEKYGEWDIEVGENISYGYGTAREIVCQLLIDDGVPNRGHRDLIFNKKYNFIGVSIKDHSKYRWVCVITFSGVFNEY